MRRLLLIAVLGCLLAPVSGAGGATLPPGFQEEVVFAGLTNPMVVRFSPDGRVFVAEKSGLIKVFDSLADPTPNTYADLRTKVHNYWDRGLLGMVLDPQFPTDPYVYVLYTHDAAIGGTAPRWGTAGATSDPCPNPPGGNVDGCVVSGRLSRLSATGAETVLVTDWCQQYPSHSQGQLQFGPDGALYASAGDGAAFGFTDWGQDGSPLNPCGDPPGGVGAVLAPPTAQGGSLRAQDLRTSGDPVTLDGSIIRVNPDNGAALSSNPLFSNSDLNARRIIAHGMRNPFRIAFRPGTSELWIGDVGLGRWEEINRITDVLGTVENGGWPCYEGPATPPSWQNVGVSICTDLYAAGPSAVHAPYFSYAHTSKLVAEETCPTGSSSLSGLAFYQGGPYPAAYDGALFFSDYSRNCVWAMRAGSNGLPNPNDIVTFVAPGAGPVQLEIGPGGDLFYSGYDDGTIRRIRYFAANQPPIAVVQATPTNGIAPLFVSFDGRGSSDPEGGALAYAWDLDADGQYDDSTSATPTRTYTQNEQVTVQLRVTDPSGATDTASIVITVGNSAPIATISAPTAATTWAVGESIPFSGTGVDAQSGTLPASAFLWELVLHHCPSTCHEHELQSFAGVRNGAFDGPNHDYPAHLELRLTVTDSGGLEDTKSVVLQPKTVQTTFATSVPGLQLTVDDDTGAAPFTRTTIVGSTHTVSAPATQTLFGVEFTFESWSDGGARVHQLTTTSGGTVTAQYSGGAPAACFYNPATKSVAASMAPTSQATLKIAASGQLLFGLVPMPCGGATATNTDTVVVTGTPGTAERLTIDQLEAPFPRSRWSPTWAIPPTGSS
jgi:glucose/arabinose dehydrogenase